MYTPKGLLEPCAVKVARTVLRGPGCGNTPRLPDMSVQIGDGSRLGSFYPLSVVQNLPGLGTLSAVLERIDSDRILCLVTADEKPVYPVFQFEEGTVLPELEPILQVLLPAAATPWTVADWLVAPKPGLDGRPIDEVRAGNTGVVLALAKQDAAAWLA